MAAADVCDGRAKQVETINVANIGKDGSSEALCLNAVFLVAGAEHSPKLGVRFQHSLIKDRGDGFAMLAECGKSGLHNLFLSFEH
jgi:hypothetical protein